MIDRINILLQQYISNACKIYGNHLRQIVLYGSYAREDYNAESDIDIMILLDLSDEEIKEYRHCLSDMTYDFNMDYDINIKPIVKNEEHYQKWISVYPFYQNIDKEGVTLYTA